MKKSTLRTRFTPLSPWRVLIAATAAVTLSQAPCQAQSSFLWDGGDGSSPLWSTAGNWNPDGAPTNFFNANFSFGGTLNTGTILVPLNNDLTNGTITNLTFNAGAGTFYLGGNAFTNRGNIINASGGSQSMSLGMVLGVNAPYSTNTHFIDVGTGSITNSGSIAAPTANASLAKIGTGTLIFNSPLTNTIGNGTPGGGTGYWVPGFGVDEGTMIFDGGPTSVYNITGEGAFGRNAPTGNRNVSVKIQSGKVASTTWIAIGRGNGTGDVLAELTLNGSSILNPVNWSGCYNSGDAAKRPRGNIVQNGTSLLWVTGTDNNAESAGSFLTHTLNDSSTYQVGTTTYGQTTTANIGMAGRYVLKQTSPTATFTSGRMIFGTAAGGAGAFYNRGNFILYSPANTAHFGIGYASGGSTPANNSYGYYLHDTATPVNLSEIGVGGANGGDGVLEVRQGTLSMSNWITICRSQATVSNSAQSGLLLIRGGTVVAPNVEQFRLLYAASTNTQYAVVDVAGGGKIATGVAPTAGSVNSAIDLSVSANALSFSTLTLGAGGTIEIGRIFAGQPASLNIVNLNGGTLSPTKSINGYIGANLDGVYVYSGGVTFDTKGFDISITPQLQAPMGNGITSIPVLTPGAGYIGRPIVRIADSTGVGATAIADWNEAAGTITGVTITCPGSGYSAPTVALVGGGFTNAATLGTPVLGAVTSGGLTKTGAGTLTLTGGGTYTGPTVIAGGTLVFTLGTYFPSTPGALTVTNATMSVDDTGGYSTLALGNFTLQNNAVLTLNYGTLLANPFAAAINAGGGLSAPGTNIVINISAFGLTVGTFPLIQYTGAALPNLANFSLGPLPPGVVATLVNNTLNKTVDLNVTSAGQNLAWYGLLPDGFSVSSNWDITLTTNWVGVGTFSPALRYQEYTSAGLTVGDPVRFDDQVYNNFVDPAPTNVFLAATLRPFLITVDSALAYSFTGPGYLSGIGSLTKTNTGTLTLGTSNDFTGGTRVGGGLVVISSDANLGAPTSLLTLSGGGLQVNGNITNTRPMSLLADAPFRVASGMTAQLGGLFSGTARLLFNDTGTAILTNREAMGFHVRNGTLIFDGAARITNNYSFTSVGLGSAPGDFGRLIIQSNALFEINQDFNIGDINDARGRVDIVGNGILRTLNLWLGKNDTCTGLVYQTGGIVTNYLTGGTDWRLAGNEAIRGPTTFGGYYLSGGRVDVQKNFQIGAYGTGEMIVTGGAVNQWAGYPVVGRFTNGVGTLTVSGGQFNHLSTGTFMIIGENGTGTLNINGTGVVTLTNDLRLGNPGGNGTVNLGTGGRLITTGVQLLNAAGSGTFNFNGGTLVAKANNSTFLQGLTAANVLAAGAVIDTAGWDVTIAQPLLAGGGGLTKLGAGTLTLSGASTYAGTTLVNTGRVLVAPAFTATGQITVADGGGFGISLPAPGVVNVGALTLGTAGATTLDFSLGTNGNPVAPVLIAGSLSVNGTCTVRVAGRLSVGTFPVLKYTGAIGGAGFAAFNPVVPGPQGMIASLSNYVAGSTLYVTISSLGPGLVWTGTNSVPALTNLWDLNTTTNWIVNGTPTTYQELVPPGDSVTFNDVGSGVVILSNSASPSSVLLSNVSKSYTIRGPGRIAGPTSFVKAGTGAATMALSGNDYLGDTLVNTGTLQLGSTNAIPDGAGRGALNVASAGTLELNGWSETINGLTGTGLINNNNTTNVVLTVGNGDASTTWSGTINNNGAGGVALTKVGNGTMTVTGTNYLNNGAASQINGGTLIIPTNGYVTTPSAEFWIAQNATTGTVVVAGGTLEAANNWIAIGRNNAAANGTLIVNSGKVIKSGNANIVLGSLGGTGTLIVNGGEVLNNGMLWLGENATANGYLYLNGGLVQATQVRSNGVAPLASVAYFNGGTLQASGNNANYIQCGALVQSRGLVLDDNGYSIALSTSPLEEDPLSTGGGLTKLGAGTVTFNVVNTYTGPTVVSNGTLLVNGSLGIGNVTVRSGATLGGTGIISGTVSVNLDGTLGSGPAIGTLTLNTSPTLNGRVFAKIDRNGGAPLADKIAVGSSLAYGGTLAITNIGAPLQVGDTFDLFDATSLSGSFTIVSYTPGQAVTWDTSLLATDGTIKVASIMVATPVSVGYSYSGNTLTLTWPADHTGWRLQVQTNSLAVGISTNWFTVPGSTATNQVSFPVDTANGTVFYRLLYP